MINLRKADIYPRATQHIQEICEGIKKLLEKGLAYESEGNIWYDVSEFEEYGKLSGKSLEELEEGARIEPDPSKRDPLDFSLWKKKKEKEPFFYSPFSEGRPGWHIECSAMSMKHLGETIDIHGGGEDLIFPHHENEIAQSEGITGKEFAKYWFHVGLVRMKGEKMSKSTGLFFKAKKALERYSPNVLRYFLLRAHYRSPLEYSEDIMETSKKSWERIENFINLEEQKEISTFSERAKNYLKKFEEYMENDLNTPKVFALLYELVSLGNRLYQESNEEFFEIKAVIELILQIMGFKREERKIDFQEELLSLIIEIRQKLREEKNFKLSDKIREKLKSLGIVVEDTKDKPRIKFLK
jgi:cysteinyl-tRNA synthetase